MSITPRTAGFNSIDYGQATDSTNFLTILLMFIGGSPGSTAGGVKTTTVALLVLLAAARFRGRTTTDLWGRTIPEESIQRAVGLSVASFAPGDALHPRDHDRRGRRGAVAGAGQFPQIYV